MIDAIGSSLTAAKAPERVDRGAVPPPAEIKAETSKSDLAKVQYHSPVIKLEVDTQTAILQYRDGQTGEVTRQYRSDEAISAQFAEQKQAADKAATAAAAKRAEAEAAPATGQQAAPPKWEQARPVEGNIVEGTTSEPVSGSAVQSKASPQPDSAEDAAITILARQRA